VPCVCHLRFSRSFVRNVVNCHSSVLPLSPLSFPVVEAIGCSVALLFIMCKLYCFGLKDCLTEADGFRRQSVSVCQRRTALLRLTVSAGRVCQYANEGLPYGFRRQSVSFMIIGCCHPASLTMLCRAVLCCLVTSDVSWDSAVNSMGDVRNRLCFVSVCVCGVRCETLLAVCFSCIGRVAVCTQTAVVTVVCVSADHWYLRYKVQSKAFLCHCFCVDRQIDSI